MNKLFGFISIISFIHRLRLFFAPFQVFRVHVFSYAIHRWKCRQLCEDLGCNVHLIHFFKLLYVSSLFMLAIFFFTLSLCLSFCRYLSISLYRDLNLKWKEIPQSFYLTFCSFHSFSCGFVLWTKSHLLEEMISV